MTGITDIQLIYFKATVLDEYIFVSVYHTRYHVFMHG